jgi:DNA-binding LytR/AlgR family response regulator
MKNTVDIEVVIDEESTDPKVKIFAKEKNRQVENIINAIENVTDSEFPLIPAMLGEGLEFLPQKDIVRAYTDGRKVSIQTADSVYVYRKNLSVLEEDLNPTRFIRISQSEIINIYKVKKFDINVSGKISVEFEDGSRTWASRSCVKAIREFLRG